jgi:carbamate kinase
VGLLALQAASYTDTSPYPLDILGAESEGMIGYLLEQGLTNTLAQPVAAVLTQVLVDGADPAFAHPTKPIGPVYSKDEAEEAAAIRSWQIAPDGDHWRRVVPSPDPLEIVEVEAIRLLIDAGVLVICAGGGGIPVVADSHGALHGVEAVIDKDLAAALLASRVNADLLLMLTDVDGVYENWGGEDAHCLELLSTDAARDLVLPAGSMGPKVQAAVRFASAYVRQAAIGGLRDAQAILAGCAGTWITPEFRAGEPRGLSTRPRALRAH